MTQVSLLIFDLDGTLVDSAGDIKTSLNHTLSCLALPQLSADQVRECIGDGVHSLLSRASGREDSKFLQKAADIFMEHYGLHCVDGSPMYPGVLDTLQFFQSKKMVIVSNKPKVMADRILKKYGIWDNFELVLGGDSTLERKPHPEPIFKSLEACGVEAQFCLIVGDGVTDILAGQSAGVKTCAVTYGYKSRDILAKLNPDYMIDTFESLRYIVE